MLCVACAATVVTAVDAWKFWITPWLSSTIANTNDSGIRTRVLERTVSTQKLPSVLRRRRRIPRMNAAANAIPTAAEMNWCQTSPTIWLSWLIVASPV